MTVAVPMREAEQRVDFLGIAATLGVLGVAFNLNSDDGTLPKIIAGVAVVALIWSIHRYGRLGPDQMIVFEEPEEAPAPKKKKKKKRAARGPSAPDAPSSNDGL